MGQRCTRWAVTVGDRCFSLSADPSHGTTCSQGGPQGGPESPFTSSALTLNHFPHQSVSARPVPGPLLAPPTRCSSSPIPDSPPSSCAPPDDDSGSAICYLRPRDPSDSPAPNPQHTVGSPCPPGVAQMSPAAEHRVRPDVAT